MHNLETDPQLKTLADAQEKAVFRLSFTLSPVRAALFALFFYLAIAIAFTWPLVLHLSDRVMLTESGDVWQHIWNNWWIRFSWLDLHTLPYTTPMLFHPTGANLYFHALDPLDGYLSVGLQLLFGLVAAFNLNIIFQLTIAGWGAYLLARYLTGNQAAGLVAGLIYACSPLESRLLNLGQLELTAIEWLPLFVLCFIKTLNREARPWRWRSLSVLFLLLLSFSTWYYLLYAIIFSLLFTLYKLGQERGEWREKWPRTVLLAGGVMAVYGILILPVLLPTLREAGSGGTQQKIFTVIYNSATVRGLFTTGPSALWGVFGSGPNLEYRGNFLGYITLALAGLGLITRFRAGWFWGLVALLFLVLALGPVLHFSFDPDWTPQTAESGPPMPGKLLYYLPFGNIARVPLRYSLVTMLALGILAAYGLDWFARRQAKRGRLALAGVGLAGLLVFLEFFPGGRTLAETGVHPFYTQLRNEGQWNDFAVLETPDRGNASIVSRAMYFQTVHQHPMVGGYLSRKPDYPFKEYPGIAELLTLDYRVFQRDILERSSLSNTLGLLNYYNIGYVIVHPALLTDEDSRFNARSVLQTVFGPAAKPYFEDTQLQVWKVPSVIEVNSRPDAARILPQLGEGWGKREDRPNSGIERSVSQQARLGLFNPYRQSLKLDLRVVVRAESGQAQLTALLNGQKAGGKTVIPEYGGLTLNLALSPGMNEVIFNTSGPIYFGQFQFANS